MAKLVCLLLLSFSAAVFFCDAAQQAPGVKLATFDGKDKTTTWTWRDLDDPVMGGQSHSTWTINQTTGIATFDGENKIVPKLKAPGFCNAETTNGLGVFTRGNDASEYDHLLLRVRSTIPYDGFKVSFAADTINPQFYSYKADFNVSHGGEWQTVAIPFTSFSNDWSSYTGRCDTTDPNGRKHKCCSKEHPEVCPTKKNLKHISQLGFWAEGVAGKFHLEVQWVGAGSAPPTSTVEAEDQPKCCVGKCDKPGYAKYYSIADGKDGTPHCGETCIRPSFYPVFKVFEPHLAKADAGHDSPCEDNGFTKYDSTVTHGALFLKVTLDLYDKP